MSRVERWEKRSDVPLLLLASAFLVAYVWPVLDPKMDPDLRSTLDAISWAVWVAFGADFTIRVVLADDRWRYAWRHWYDVILIAVPLLRPLRLLRLLALARLLDRSLAGSFAGRVVAYVAGGAIFAWALGAIAVLDAEQDAPDGNITTFGGALWWSLTTVTTVGYGDHFPVTFQGRVIAGALMLVGIGLVGTVTAGVAAYFVQHVSNERPADADSVPSSDQ